MQPKIENMVFIRLPFTIKEAICDNENLTVLLYEILLPKQLEQTEKYFVFLEYDFKHWRVSVKAAHEHKRRKL